MPPCVLITGSSGLIGRALLRTADRTHFAPLPYDLRTPAQSDVRDALMLRNAMIGCAGVIHLAAVSRVIHGERDPDLCWDTNVQGTAQVLAAALASPLRPWVLIASSREVYGQPDRLPANEDAPLSPVNVYGRSKAAAEDLAHQARAAGLRTAILRFSNVYGCPEDHKDRVVPAFARGAALGQPLRVDGAAHLFDFTHVEDTAAGVWATARLLQAGQAALPPLHLLTGVATSLGDLADLAIRLAGSKSPVHSGPPRTYDVARFCGDPGRAVQVLGWRAQVPLQTGLMRLIKDFQARGETLEAA